MKILFYDGNLDQFSDRFLHSSGIKYEFPLTAANGYSSNVKALNDIVEDLGYNTTILTNSLVALDHRYGWNNEEGHTDIYFYVESKHDFVRCDKLTEREIHEGHNIMKMFMNNEFDIEQQS